MTECLIISFCTNWLVDHVIRFAKESG